MTERKKQQRTKKFLVLKVIATIDAKSFDEARAQANESFPDDDELLIEELKG